MSAQEGLQWGFFNALHAPERVLAEAQALAAQLAAGPTFAHGVTKKLLHREWNMGRRSDRSGSRGAGHLHADAGFPPRLRSFRGQVQAGVRRRLRSIHVRQDLSGTALLRRGAPYAGARSRYRCEASLHVDHGDTDAACRALVRQLGEAGWLRYCVPAAHGGRCRRWIRARCACCARRWRATTAPADFAFAMQGLGSGAITLAGSESAARALPAARGARRGHRRLRAVGAGSRLRRGRHAVQRPAVGGRQPLRAGWRQDWISNGGIADFYCVFARTGEAPGARGISAFVVDAGTPGRRSPSASK